MAAKKSATSEGTPKKVSDPKAKSTAAQAIVPAVKTSSSIHPNYRVITVKMTDGTTFQTRSTYKDNELVLDVDKLTHPAWTKGANYINESVSEVARFSERFKGISFIKK